jgi:MerR family transcriptional regulator, thiopeptide resistance regulator
VGFKGLKVGDLARRTGLTVRALHHYDKVGLLKPSLRTDSGHRLYTSGDVARLQQILSLRQVGFSLEEIRDCLAREDFSPLAAISLHIKRLRERIDRERRICKRLEAIADRLRLADEVSAGEFLRIIKEMIMIEDYYSSEQLDYLKKRRELIGEERMNQVPGEWAALIGQVRAEMEKGSDPLSPQVLALAKRWQGLVNEFTGGDPGIERSVGRLWNERGDNLVERHGAEYDLRGLTEYIGQAIAAVKGGT